MQYFTLRYQASAGIPEVKALAAGLNCDLATATVIFSDAVTADILLPVFLPSSVSLISSEQFSKEPKKWTVSAVVSWNIGHGRTKQLSTYAVGTSTVLTS